MIGSYNLFSVVLRVVVGAFLSTAVAVPVGIWGGKPYTEECMDADPSCNTLQDLTQEFGFTFVATRMKAGYLANTFLPHIEEKGWKAVISFTDQWTPADDADGCDGEGRFTLDAWKKNLREDRYFDDEDETYAEYVETINEYVTSGTLIAAMMADDVMNYGEYGWDECDPKPIALNLMGAELKSLFPDLPVWIRIDPTDLKDRYDDTSYFVPAVLGSKLTGGRIPSNIDAAVAQYIYQPSDPISAREYAIEQKSAADALEIDVVCGLNIADGGDGTSGQEGYRGEDTEVGRTFYAMSPDEISSYGKKLIRNTDCDHILLWEFNGEYEWPDGTIGGEYFQSDEDYKDAAKELEDCNHSLFGCMTKIWPWP